MYMREYIIKLNVEAFWVNLKQLEVENKHPFLVLSNFVLTVLSLPQSNFLVNVCFAKLI